jgi:hypothetical protein
MSFYVTLPSDTRKGPSGNTRQNYSTFFSPPISVPTPYEVALTDFLFSPELRVVYGQLRLKCTIAGHTLFSEPMTLEHQEKDSLAKLAKEINTVINTLAKDMCNKIKAMAEAVPTQVANNDISAYYDTDIVNVYVDTMSQADVTTITLIGPASLTEPLDTHILETYSKVQKLLNKSGQDLPYKRSTTSLAGKKETISMYKWTIPNTIYKTTSSQISAKLKSSGWTMSTALPGTIPMKPLEPLSLASAVEAEVLLVKPTPICVEKWFGNDILVYPLLAGPLSELITGLKDEILFHGRFGALPTNPQLVHSLLVYTDIIEEQYYGGDKLQVLHTHRLQDEKGHAMLESPHYLNINKSCISSINIRIHDREGNPVKFTNKFGHVEVKLHFKPR